MEGTFAHSLNTEGPNCIPGHFAGHQRAHVGKWLILSCGDSLIFAKGARRVLGAGPNPPWRVGKASCRPWQLNRLS